ALPMVSTVCTRPVSGEYTVRDPDESPRSAPEAGCWMLDVRCWMLDVWTSPALNPEPLTSVRLQTLNPTAPQTEATAPQPLQIQRAFRLLKSHARHDLQVNHRGLDVAVPQKLLDRLQVIIRQQQVNLQRYVGRYHRQRL